MMPFPHSASTSVSSAESFPESGVVAMEVSERTESRREYSLGSKHPVRKSEIVNKSIANPMCAREAYGVSYLDSGVLNTAKMILSIS